jgi:hypothetical protein
MKRNVFVFLLTIFVIWACVMDRSRLCCCSKLLFYLSISLFN